MKTYVIAMDCEAKCVVDNMEGVRERKLCGRRVVEGTLRGESAAVIVSGIGKSNAAAATQLAICVFGTDEILNLGLCGGVEPGMAVGDIYEVSQAVQYDFDIAKLNGTSVGVLNERKTPYIPLATTGRFPAKTLATGDRFNDEVDDLPLLKALGAGLRDMEGAAIAHVCETAGVVCRSLKCVSDAVGADCVAAYSENRARCLASLKSAVASFSDLNANG